MKLSDIITVLAREPFNIPPPVSARMSMDQITLALRSPKDIPADDTEPLTFRDIHRTWAMRNRIPDWLEDELWNKRGQ